MPWLAYPQGGNRKATDGRLVRPALRGALLGLDIGISQSTLPVGAGRFRRTPHIVLSGAFLALRVSDCNGWVRRWVSGRRRDRDPGEPAVFRRKGSQNHSRSRPEAVARCLVRIHLPGVVVRRVARDGCLERFSCPPSLASTVCRDRKRVILKKSSSTR